jgi:inosose dehydratase
MTNMQQPADLWTNDVSRREFLRTTAAAGLLAAGAGFPATLFADEEPQKSAAVRFGFSLYGMRKLPVKQALETCAEIGYDGVELVCNDGWPCDPFALSPSDRTGIRKQLGDTGLELSALMENLHVVVDDKQHRQNLDRLKAAGELAHELSPDKPPIIETILGSKPDRWEKEKEQMAAGLADWARVAEETKTIFAVKPHVGGALHTPEGARWLVEKVNHPRIRLTYDYSHFQLRDFDLEKSLKQLIDLAAFVHVKDRRGKLGDFRFLLPGEGDIDYVQYFKLLKQAGYRGAVVVEVSGQIHGKPGYDPVAAAKTSYENLAPAFTKAGLRRG